MVTLPHKPRRPNYFQRCLPAGTLLDLLAPADGDEIRQRAAQRLQDMLDVLG